MGSVPPYHPEWIIRFWFSTPGLRSVDPHLTLAIITILVAGVIFFMRRKRQPLGQADPEEARLKHLLAKQKVIRQQMAELEKNLNGEAITPEAYSLKRKEYEKHLERTEQELRQFTL